MIKTLLLSLAVASSYMICATSPKVTDTLNEYITSDTDYYTKQGSYDNADYFYSGLYVDNGANQHYFDYTLNYLDQGLHKYVTFYDTALSHNVTYGVVAYASPTYNTLDENFCWMIISSYQDGGDRISTSFDFVINPRHPFDTSLFAVKLDLTMISLSTNGVFQSTNTEVGNLNFKGNLKLIVDNTQYDTYSCFMSGGTNIYKNGQIEEDWNIQEYGAYEVVGILRFSVMYGLGGLNYYQNGYNQGLEVGYQDGLDDGYFNGYQVGLAKGRSEGSNFITLMGSVADTPIIIFRSLFNVQILGVNMYLIVTSLISLLLVIWIIKKVLL